MLAVRRTDLSAGSCGCCPIPAMGATTPNVFILGMNPMVVGDVYGPHPCGGKHCRHVEVCVAGFPNVLVAGRPLVVSGMQLSCGDTALQGAPSVTVG